MLSWTGVDSKPKAESIEVALQGMGGKVARLQSANAVDEENILVSTVDYSSHDLERKHVRASGRFLQPRED